VGIVVDEAAVGIGGVEGAAAEAVVADGEDRAVVGGEDGGAVGGTDVERGVTTTAAVARLVEGVGYVARCDAGDGDHQAAGAERGRDVVATAEDPAPGRCREDDG
jgi:hypothetical protein